VSIPLSGGATQLPIRATFNSSSLTGPAHQAAADMKLRSNIAAIFDDAMGRSFTNKARYRANGMIVGVSNAA
jgi:hypothetical protein